MSWIFFDLFSQNAEQIAIGQLEAKKIYLQFGIGSNVIPFRQHSFLQRIVAGQPQIIFFSNEKLV